MYTSLPFQILKAMNVIMTSVAFLIVEVWTILIQNQSVQRSRIVLKKELACIEPEKNAVGNTVEPCLNAISKLRQLSEVRPPKSGSNDTFIHKLNSIKTTSELGPHSCCPTLGLNREVPMYY